MSAPDINDGRPDEVAWDLIPEDEPNRVAAALVAIVEWLVSRDRYRILDGRVLEDLYGGRWVTSQDLMPGVSAYAESGGDPVKLNFARNAVDFVHTKLCAETPSVVATARGGGYAQERRADLLSRYVDRLSEEVDLESLCSAAGLTALRTGDGILKAYVRDGRPALELVPSEWVYVDQTEARCGNPTAIYERRPVARRWAMDEFVGPDGPGRDRKLLDAEAAIQGAAPAIDPLNVGFTAGTQTVSDLIDIYEAWAFGTPDRPGRHVICVMGHVLLDEPWTLPRSPHSFMKVDPPPVGRGFWARGLLAQLDESQAEIDFLLGQVSEQIRMARLKVFVPSQDLILKEDHLADSAQGTIVRFDAQAGKPLFETPPSVSREALEHIQWLVKEMYEVAGMSETAASSQRPAGINSGRAIEYFHDFQTRRFVATVQAYGRFVVDVVDRLLDRAEELHTAVDDGDGSDGDGTGRPQTGDDGLRWSQVRMDREDFVLDLETVSPVPRTYAGRMQRIEQLIAQGQIPPGYWAEYLKDPDAWRAEHRAAAQAEHIDWLLTALEDVDADMPPLSDKLDFDLAKEVLTGETLTLIRKGAEQERIDRLEDFFDMVVQRQKELATPPAGAPNGPQGPAAPGAGPPPAAAGTAPMPMGGLAPTNPNG